MATLALVETSELSFPPQEMLQSLIALPWEKLVHLVRSAQVFPGYMAVEVMALHLHQPLISTFPMVTSTRMRRSNPLASPLRTTSKRTFHTRHFARASWHGICTLLLEDCLYARHLSSVAPLPWIVRLHGGRPGRAGLGTRWSKSTRSPSLVDDRSNWG